MENVRRGLFRSFISTFGGVVFNTQPDINSSESMSRLKQQDWGDLPNKVKLELLKLSPERIKKIAKEVLADVKNDLANRIWKADKSVAKSLGAKQPAKGIQQKGPKEGKIIE